MVTKSSPGDTVNEGRLPCSLHVLTGVSFGGATTGGPRLPGHAAAARSQHSPACCEMALGSRSDSARSFCTDALPFAWGLALCEILPCCSGHTTVHQSQSSFGVTLFLRAPLFCHLSLRSVPSSEGSSTRVPGVLAVACKQADQWILVC